MMNLQVRDNLDSFIAGLDMTKERLGETFKSFMAREAEVIRDIMKSNAPRKTGKLVESIIVESTADGLWVGPTAVSDTGFPYPIVVEYGRGEVVASRARALRFTIGGMTLFRKRVGPAAGSHFVARTHEEVGSRIADDLTVFIREALK